MAVKGACSLQQDSDEEKKEFLSRIKEIVHAHRLCKVDPFVGINIH